jgi:hypothetical protein
MKALLTLLLAGCIGLTLAGCRASAEVDTDHDTGSRTIEKKTTIKTDDGYRSTETEVRTTP